VPGAAALLAAADAVPGEALPDRAGVVMTPFFRNVLCIQVATFVVLGILFIKQGDWRLGVTQLLLAVVQGVLYSGSMVK
jgi:hypothetical protein